MNNDAGRWEKSHCLWRAPWLFSLVGRSSGGIIGDVTR